MQTDQPYSPNPDVKTELLCALPKLRAFAISMCGQSGGRRERSDDLVQETMVRALANINSFEPGTNMAGWLYAILRNEFYSEYRKRRHEVQDEGGIFAAKLQSKPSQEGHMHFLELRDAMNQLGPEQREALILVAAAGHSYEDAATLTSCAIGTVKSRVNRARARLAVLLAAPTRDLVPDITWADTQPPQRDGVLEECVIVNGGMEAGLTSSFATAV
jgi:RNA polymerase sigma-70 factor, ECF subfamily